MINQFSRTEILLGKGNMEKLQNAKVLIFGVGGVGGFVAEALARSGVGTIDLVDDDKVSLTNINRQLIATNKTIGKYKVDIMKERIEDINPEVSVTTYKCFYTPETREDFDFTKYTYIVDAIDTVTAKLDLVIAANQVNVPIISSMGAGNKLDPTKFKVSDIYKTSVCPLAKVMRRELKKRNVKKLKVVYSEEKALKPAIDMSVYSEGVSQNQKETRGGKPKRSIPGSIAFVPSVVGLIIAGEIVKDIVF
jgi:Dinucleotide-utilizing enzymes involved in molybdopterin and thiamine biosynthesis family 1